MHKIALSLATFISDDRHNIERIEMISYSLEAILSTFITTIIAFIISIIFNYTYIFFTFSAIFVIIRMMHKGFHFKSFLTCCLYSNVMIFISCLIIKYCPFNIYEFFLFYILIAIHYYLSIEKNKILTITCTLFFTLFLTIYIQISYSIFISIIIDIFLIIGRKIQWEHLQNQLENH